MLFPICVQIFIIGVNVILTKTCVVCSEELPLNKFSASHRQCNRCRAERSRDYSREYGRRNRERLRKYSAEKTRERRTKVPHETFWSTSRYHAKLSGSYSDLTKEDAADVYYSPDICAYCGKERDNAEGERKKREFHIDHIVPLRQGGVNSRWNLVKVCISCNSSKNDRSLLDFYERTDAFTPDRYEAVISDMVRLSGRTRAEIDVLLTQSHAFELAHLRERERMDAMMRVLTA